LEAPFALREFRYLHLDQATFLERTFISEERGWPLQVGGAPDDDVLSIFTMVNSPLQGAGKGQTIELIINLMHYLLLGTLNDTGRGDGDLSFPCISEPDGVELAEPVWGGINDDTIDAGRGSSKSGSSSSHRGLRRWDRWKLQCRFY
jgi:hypothetical protein